MLLFVNSNQFDYYLFDFRQVKFHNSSASNAKKRIAEEEIVEVEDLASKQAKVNQPTSSGFKKPQNIRNGLNSKLLLSNLVRRKPAASSTCPSESSVKLSTSLTKAESNEPSSSSSQPPASGLSLLSSYSSNSNSDDSE